MYEFLKFYSRKDIQKEILRVAQNREVAVKFGDRGFGKRPEILQFEADILEFAKRGVTSFHISEEIWENPLDLKPGMTKKQLDSIRQSWDLILDIDCQIFELSKITAELILEALKFHDIKEPSIKFSGNKGFHIAVPFSWFPQSIKGQPTCQQFPEGPRLIAAYIKEMIKEHLAARFLEKYSIDELCEQAKKKKEDMVKDDVFNPFTISEIDTILISSRHLFRAPFSFHEKSGLVSVPFDVKDLARFDKLWAKPENVKVDVKYLDEEKKCDASNLILQAFDMESKKLKQFADIEPTKGKKERVYEDLKIAVKEDFFPPCIKKCLVGNFEDGKKRALFVLINFLKNMAWKFEDIEKRLKDWNKTHPEPLRENYLITQLSWHKRQKSRVLPPNCDNPNYYKDIQICVPDNFCRRIKNPINYSLLKLKAMKK